MNKLGLPTDETKVYPLPFNASATTDSLGVQTCAGHQGKPFTLALTSLLVNSALHQMGVFETCFLMLDLDFNVRLAFRPRLESRLSLSSFIRPSVSSAFERKLCSITPSLDTDLQPLMASLQSDLSAK